MTGKRTALLVATDTYADPAFHGLAAPRHDAAELATLLGDNEIGGFTTTVLTNGSCNDTRISLDEMFSEAGREDLLLFYVSGHGVKDEAGNLHLVMADTRRTLLAATAISAQFIRELIDHSPARRVVVWLDCCYAGAFPAGMVPKAEGTVDVVAQLNAKSGRGCAVMTASTHIQYAYERGGTMTATGRDAPSVFTNAIAEGLRTGAADLNADGEIDAAELYSYVYDQVRLVTPDQTPTRNDQLSGDLYIARSKLGLGLPAAIDVQLRLALRSHYGRIRVGAVQQLGEMAADGDADARTALTLLAAGTESVLADAAKTILGIATPQPTPPAEPEPQPEPQPPLTLPWQPVPAQVASVELTPKPQPKPVPRPGSRPIVIGAGPDGHPAHVDFGRDPNFLVFADDGFGKTNLLSVIARGVTEHYTPKEAVFLIVDYRRTMLGVLDDAWIMSYGVRSDQLGTIVTETEAALRKRLDQPGQWPGPDLFVLVDDYQLLPHDNPLAPFAALVDQPEDIGLHLVVGRIATGASRALTDDPLLSALHVHPTPGVVGDGSAFERSLLGSTAPKRCAPGHGTLVDRDRHATPVSIRWRPGESDRADTAPEPTPPPKRTAPRRAAPKQPPSWQDELRELDNRLANGEISANEYRQERDMVLMRATDDATKR